MSTCALSGNIPEQPVVAKTTGLVFEKRLILKHLETSTTCPITTTPLCKEDLLDIQQLNPITKPRPPTATSFPHLLNLLQNEYDAMLLESYQLKQQLDQCKKDLAKQLYQQDAAHRVISRLYKENEELKQRLYNYDATFEQKHGQILQQVAPALNAIAHNNNNTNNNTDINTMTDTDLTVDPFAIIQSATEAVPVGKENRKAVLEYRKNTQNGYHNFSTAYNAATAKSDQTIVWMKSALGAKHAATTDFINTAGAGLQTSSVAISEKRYLSFISTQNNEVLVLENDVPKKTTRVVTTLGYNQLFNHNGQNENDEIVLTGLSTSLYDNKLFKSVINTTPGDDLCPLYISYTNKTQKKHFISIYTTDLKKNDAQFANVFTFSTPTLIKTFALHPSMMLLIAVGADNHIYLYNLQYNVNKTASNLLYTIADFRQENINCLTIHPDAKFFMLGCDGGLSISIPLTTLGPQQQQQEVPCTKFQHPQRTAPITAIVCSESGYHYATVFAGVGFAIHDLRKPPTKPEHCTFVPLSNVKRLFFDQLQTHCAVVTTDDIQIVTVKDPAVVKAKIVLVEERMGGEKVRVEDKIDNALMQCFGDGIVVVTQHKVFFLTANGV